MVRVLPPYTPYFIDGGIRYASFEMGLTPSKYPQKNQNRVLVFDFWRHNDNMWFENLQNLA